MKTETKSETINPRLNIEEKMRIYILLLESGDAAGKAFAKKEMMEIARKLRMLYLDGIGKPD